MGWCVVLCFCFCVCDGWVSGWVSARARLLACMAAVLQRCRTSKVSLARRSRRALHGHPTLQRGVCPQL